MKRKDRILIIGLFIFYTASNTKCGSVFSIVYLTVSLLCACYLMVKSID